MSVYSGLPGYGNYQWKAAAETVGALPSNGNAQGDARVVLADSSIYVWDGAAWQAISGGGGGSSFGTIQTDAGTSPVADQSNDTLTLTSSDLTITGNSATDTVTIALPTVPVAKGGTNSTTALNNNRVIQSASGKIQEAAAITASRALISDANGIPTHSAVTSTTLGYLDATSSVQTQMDAKAPLASPTFTTAVTFGNYKLHPSEYDAGNSSTAITLDWTNGSAQKVTMNGNCVFTLNNPQTGGAYVLKLVQDSTGSRTYTWPAAVKWAGGSGSAPVGSGVSKIDVVNLYWDGTNYFGSYALNY